MLVSAGKAFRRAVAEEKPLQIAGATCAYHALMVKRCGYKALYPLGAFRAMNTAALAFYETVRKTGTQKSIIPQMQTRDELYDFLNYLSYEQKLDELFTRERS